MILRRVTIAGFRSVPKQLEVHVRSQLTCLIGANEHGKTNILDAVSCLTTREFGPEDVNSETSNADHPWIAFHLELLEAERTTLLAELEKLQTGVRVKIEQAESAPPPSPEALAQSKKESVWYGNAITHFKSTNPAFLDVTLVSDGRLRLDLHSFTWTVKIGAKVEALIGIPLPEIRLFAASQELSDTITLSELEARKNLPFEGLLKLAGVWETRSTLFSGDLEAHRLHVTAGRTLTRRLRRLWTQGEAHTIRLAESSGKLRISIEDPTTLDSPSRRSLGFRSFLSFALTLFAETATFTPHDYVLLFDEPGLHLHPQGQKDLLRELRRLAKNNQIIYSTHSPFLIDRNDPTAALLVRKDLRGKQRGTRIVNKPYGANWASVLNALGITPSDAFFPPNKVLVVEGTSDRLYIARYMGLCVRQTHADLNYLHVVDADRRDEIPGTSRLYLNAGSSLVILVDSDKGGDDFTKSLKRLFPDDRNRLHIVNLREHCDLVPPLSIEDLLPLDSWFPALSKYAADILGYDGDLVQGDLLAKKRGITMGTAAATYFHSLGVLPSPDKFSKTTVADLFCQQELATPLEGTAMSQLCSALSRALSLNT